MRTYELALILPPDLDSQEREKVLTKIKKDLEDAGGKIEKEEDWGSKELVYRINKETQGYFLLWWVDLPPEAIGGFESKLKLEAKILRFLLVKSEGLLSKSPSESREKGEKKEEVKKRKSRKTARK